MENAELVEEPWDYSRSLKEGEYRACSIPKASADLFYPLNESGALAYVARDANLRAILGGDPSGWEISEVGDGNINFVFILKGPSSCLVLKQALPYIRCIGESWPLGLERTHFEAAALKQFARFCPQYVPTIYKDDRSMALLVEGYCAPPHVILRKGFIKAEEYPLLAEHVADVLSKALFFTSLLSCDTSAHRQLTAEFCENVQMRMVTEQVVFTEPYVLSRNNRWTTPQLDNEVMDLRKDSRLKVAAAQMKAKFCERAQALIHGDLHSGSIMVTQTSTQVIDAEFAFVGPMAFDLGCYIANVMLSFFSQDGLPLSPSSSPSPSSVSPDCDPSSVDDGGNALSSSPSSRDEGSNTEISAEMSEVDDGRRVSADRRHSYKQWLVRLIECTWTIFAHKLRLLWAEHSSPSVSSCPTEKAAQGGGIKLGRGGGERGGGEGGGGGGDAYPLPVYCGVEDGDTTLAIAQDEFLRELLEDSVGFAGVEMIRRIVGIAHVEDFECIDDVEIRAGCELRALRFARSNLVNRREIPTIHELVHRLSMTSKIRSGGQVAPETSKF
ncbi:hypothetical protein CBR_g12222 [Chara braunii]|uniref:S-methyl-5-thioribose kinase n=1 Tax=Chara braunii TaxID=69332 RepID=A0A388KRM2_CHABU|nr:hypothetical protein CBR_g12222 [Chara braunii]|eukprot:GBG72648.1 hypothetical protein CBR_g12222 [Chara braunii]